MKEVSCKALVALFQGLERDHLPPETLCTGVPYSLEHLRNRHERIDWDAYCQIMANVRPLWTDEEFTAIGYEFVRSKAFGAMTAIGRLLFPGMEMYKWLARMGAGHHPQIFTCLVGSSQEIEKDLWRITAEVAPGYRPCREWFLMTKGGLSAASTLIGRTPARVSMQETERGAIYDIRFPEGARFFAWVRQNTSWIVAARAAARELREANEVLHVRYAELEEARDRIQRQATQLRTAFSISEVIRSNLDLTATIKAVARSLVDVAHFAAASVLVAVAVDGEQLRHEASEGEPPAGEPVLTHRLEARGLPLGELRVWLRAGGDQGEAEELLRQVGPTIAMEIHDALSFTRLTEYRRRDRLHQAEFAQRLIESQETERKRVASELHDGLGQDLLVMSNELRQFCEKYSIPNEHLGQVAALLNDSIEGVREIASNLHPHHLDRLGFCAAIEVMGEKISRSGELAARQHCDDVDGLLSKETAIHLYRVIQEALSNVVRHAGARSVSVEIRKASGSVEITVADDGRGFLGEGGGALPTLASGEDLGGFGLSSMAERVRIVGGKLSITSSPGAGTTVHVSVPVS
jgi:signal transduction histidine kinase